MKLALFGVTGGTGRAMAEQALAAGIGIRALVRDPRRLQIDGPLLEVVTGNVLNPQQVAETVQGCDAVLVSLGNTDDNPDSVVSDGTQNIIDAMRRHSLRRIIVISSLGVGDSENQVSLPFKMVLKTMLRGVIQDKTRQEALVRASALDWTIIRPGNLTNGPATGSYLYGTDSSLQSRPVSRRDVAAFALQQLETPTFLRQTPAIVGRNE